MRLKDFLIVSNYAIENGFQEALQHAKRPLKVGGVETPSTLNDLSLFQFHYGTIKSDYAENNKGAKDISIPLWYD